MPNSGLTSITGATTANVNAPISKQSTGGQGNPIPAATSSSDSIEFTGGASADGTAGHSDLLHVAQGETAPSLQLLSTADRQKLLTDHQTARAQGRDWTDNAQTGALLLEANASPSYVARSLSPEHLRQAEQLAAAHDQHAATTFDGQVQTGIDWTSDKLSRGYQGVESGLATGKPNFGYEDPATADANRAALRKEIGASADLYPPGSPQWTVAQAYKNYNTLPHAAQGVLDTALDSACDPLTYASGGTSAIKSGAAKVLEQSPKIMEAVAKAGSATLKAFDDHVAPLIEKAIGQGGGLRPSYAGGYGGATDQSVRDTMLTKQSTQLGPRASGGAANYAGVAAKDIPRAQKPTIDLDANPNASYQGANTITGFKPNVVVKVDGLSYETDRLGRVVRVQGQLPGGASERSQTLQDQARALGRIGDQGGHWVARSLGGPKEAINHFPQNGNFNNGAFKSLENKWRSAISSNKTVQVDMTIKYSTSTARPDRVLVRSAVNGEIVKRNFANRAGGV